MRIRALLWVAIRQSRLRLVESSLIVLGIAMGAAVVTAFASLIASAGTQVRAFAESPLAREISVVPREEDYMALWQTTGGFVPAVPVGPAGVAPARLTMGDIARVRDAVTSARHVYTYHYGGLSFQPKSAASGDDTGEEGSVTTGVSSPSTGGASLLQQRGFVGIIATVPEYFRAYGLKLREGSFFVDSDVTSGAKVIVLGDRLARRLFGDASPIGRELVTDPSSPGGQAESLGRGARGYQVIGVLMPASGASSAERDRRSMSVGPLDYLDDLGFVPLTSMAPYSGQVGASTGAGTGTDAGTGADADVQVPAVYVMPPSADESAVTLDELRRFAERDYQDRVTIRSEIDEMKRALREMRSQALGGVLLASAGLVIASINILNLMLARVLRRTKAIGVSVALGASRRDVFAQLLAESLVLGVAGGVVGVVLGYAATSLMSRVTQGLSASVGTWGVLAGVGASLVASAVFGVYPAHLAARTVAVDALRRD